MFVIRKFVTNMTTADQNPGLQVDLIFHMYSWKIIFYVLFKLYILVNKRLTLTLKLELIKIRKLHVIYIYPRLDVLKVNFE